MDAYLTPCLATAQVPTPSDDPQAGDRLEVELANLADRLVEIGLDPADVDRLVAAVRDAGHDAGRSVVAVLHPDGVRRWSTSAELPARVVPGPVPALLPLLQQRQRWVPHALVVVDRVGADVRIVDTVGHDEEVSVDGATSHITKSQPGGWSQRRFQQRAEEHWQDNVRLVVQRLTDELAGTDVAVLVLAGDPHALTLLQDELPADLAGLAVQVDTGGRAADGSEAALEAAVDRVVADTAARRRQEDTAAVADAVGQGTGVTGRTDVLAALFESRVDTLLVDPRQATEVTAHIGPDPIHVAADAGRLHDLGLDARRVSLADAALRGAAGTGARVVLVDGVAVTADDGVAASLRGSEPV